MPDNKIGQVLSSAPDSIQIEVLDLKTFEENKPQLQIGRYLRIAEGNSDSVIGLIKNIKGSNIIKDDKPAWTFLIECQAIGTLVSGEKFERGSILLPVPTEPAYAVGKETLKKLFSCTDEFDFPFGKLVLNREIDLNISGDRFFGKHIAVVGSTGSGKSCAVAKILHDVVGISKCKNKNCNKQNNSHIVIFDIHSEYRTAFSLPGDEKFTLNCLDISNLNLPYWLMNSEELESMFIESNEENSHNQVSQFKHAVILNKERHNPLIKEMTYDTPVYFSITEVYKYIENMNREIIGRLPAENLPKLADGTLITHRKDHYFEKVHDFVAPSTATATKATNGPFNGEFNRFVSRLETKLGDKRLKFLLDSKKPDGTLLKTDDFEQVMRQFIGYLNKSNVTIIDMSGIPFEVLSITISLVSRLIFDFCFHYSKLKHQGNLLNDIPVMIVCEEAHNYVPRDDRADYRASRKSIERIAKEGRKYGLSLMVVSQRPSEVSDTIFAQCNNFVALRLSNSDDQNYIKHLMPDNTNAITDILPNLAPGECIVVGDAAIIPTVVQLEKPQPEPQSQSVKFLKEWRKDWKDVAFSEVIARWRKE